ncbi:MAG: hypothetical protein ABIR13_10385 [Polaromonas sp.]
MTQRFTDWKQANAPLLTGIKKGDRPKALIENLSESLLKAFASAPLIDAYDVYQHLMDYWAETMQDDAWMLATDGWQALQGGQPNVDLIAPALIVARYFAAEQLAVQSLQAARDAIARQMEELDEEHGGEDGLLADAKTEKAKLTAKSVKDRLKAISLVRAASPVRAASAVRAELVEASEEAKALEAYAALIEQEASAAKKAKDAQKALDAQVAAQYAQLSEADIQTLVVQEKWLAALSASVQSELDRISQALTGRIRQLAERYRAPLPKLYDEVDMLARRVDAHLKQMGFAL